MNRLSEVKVGVVVIFAAIVLAIILFFLLGPGRLGQTYAIDLIFSDARGLTGGEPVRMAGVQIGEVEEVSLAANRKAQVTLRIQKEVPLYEQYLFTISTGALVAERFVKVEPVAPPEDAAQLKAGDVVQGLESPGLEDLITTAQGTLSRLEQTAASINTIVGDPAIAKATRAAMINFETATGEAALLMRNLTQLSADVQPNIARAAQQVALAGEEAHKAVDALSETIRTSEAPEELEAAAAAVRLAAEEAHDTAAALNSMLTDPATQGNLKTSIENLRIMSENIREASVDIRSTTSQIKESAPQVKRVIQRADVLLEDASQIKERLKPPRVDTDFAFRLAPDAGRSFTDANFDISFAGEKQRFLRVGVSDIGEKNQVNFQAGRRLDRYDLRYGLVRGKLGAGIDYPLGNSRQLSLDFFDPNHLRADLTASLTPTGHGTNWGIIFGIRDAFGEDLGFVGARFGK